MAWRELRARLSGLTPAASGWPVATLALCALLAVALVVVQVGWSGRLEVARSDVAAVVDFAIHHPAVEVEPRLIPAVRARVPGFDGNETFAFLRDAAGRKDQVRAEQAEFDALAEAALSRVDSHPQRALGLVPAHPRALGFAAHWLVHAGWVHGLVTIAALLILAPLLERTWGWRGLAVLLSVAAVVGGLAFAGVYRGAERPLVGASGLISALAAAALVRFRGQDVDPLHWVPADLSLRAPFWTLGVVWLAYEALVWGTSGAGLPGGFEPAPAWPADLAAASAGVLAAVGVQRFGLEQRFGAGPPVLVRRRVQRRFDFERILALRAQGRGDRAYALLLAEVERSARNRDAVVTFFEMSVERGEPRRALPAMRQLIAEELRRGTARMGVSHWRAVCEHVDDAGLAPELLVQLAPAILEEKDEAMALVALRQAAGSGAAALAPALARELAELAAALDPGLAADAARRALDADGLHPDERARLESLIARASRPAAAALDAELEAPPPPPIEKKKLPKNVFYEEQDRSMFGSEVGELSSPGDEELLCPPPGLALANRSRSGSGSSPPAASRPRAPSARCASARKAEGRASRELDLLASPEPAPTPRVGVTEALPRSLTREALMIEVAGRGRVQLPFGHLHAVATAGVCGLGPRPIVLIDLLVSGPGPSGRPLRVVRLRSDTFDPRPLAPGAASPLAALRAFAAETARRAGAEILPPGSEQAPLRTFESLADYEREVLAARI